MAKEEDLSKVLSEIRLNIKTLDEELVAQLNRILAAEAMIKTIIAEIPYPVLCEMRERYDFRVLNAMQHLSPKLQRPHLWQPYLDKIEEVIVWREKNLPRQSP